MERDLQNTLFNLAVDFVCFSNKSLFLTGKAGTGKTTFLKYIQTHCRKKMAVTAPTGVAAINAGGVTLHSFFQLPFGAFLPEMSSGWGAGPQNFYNKKQLLSNLRLRQSQREVIQSLELLIIDEVSMVRSDLLDAIDAILRSVRRKPLEPFGGIQLLLIGDLYQLPPVVKQDEWMELSSYYKSPFFFDAKSLNEIQLIPITLQKIYRQQDPEFISLLNKVRNNNCQESDFLFLNKFYRPTFIPEEQDGFITLTTHNKTAAQLNATALERLPGKAVVIKAKINEDFPENAYPADETLSLKTGAQIMFIKNDIGEKRRYYNGKIGIIKKLDPKDQTIEITFPNELESISIQPETWDNIRYEYDKEKDEVKEKTLGSFCQFPIRLAWAITIHKSQGLTFENAVIDAGRSFAPGQVYVALSRMTGLSGMVLHSRIYPESIQTDFRIQYFMEKELGETDYKTILGDAQREYVCQLLVDAYDWSMLEAACENHYKGFQSRAIPNKDIAIKKAAGWLDAQLELLEVAQKFQGNVARLFSNADYKKIQERNQAAAGWFRERLDGIMAEIRTHIHEQDGKTKVKKYIKDLQELLAVLERKTTLLERSKDLTQALAQTQNIREAMIRFSAPVLVSEKEITTTKTKKGDSKKITLSLYQEGKTIEEIAKERGLATSTIAGHLTTFIPTGEISITLFLTEEEAAEIIEAAKDEEVISFGALKEKLNNRFEYPQIRAALALLEKEENTTNQ